MFKNKFPRETKLAVIGARLLEKSRYTLAGVLVTAFIFLSSCSQTPALSADLWKITAYCPCKVCCGKHAKGITASNKKVKPGMVACNWLPFGTRIQIGNKIYTVEDRGARSLFGSKSNHIKHIDVFIDSHSEACRFGVQYQPVRIIQ